MPAFDSALQPPCVPPPLARFAVPARVVTQGSSTPPVEKQETDTEQVSAEEEKKREVAAILLGEDKNTTAIERLLVDVIAQEMPLVSILEKAQLDLAKRLLPHMDNPRATLQAAKVLREVVVTSNAITKRVEHLLGSLATLRSQRRMIEQHRGYNGK